MHGESLETLDFSTWDGTPFFEGYPEEGRHVYIVKSREEGTFTAYGALDGSQQVIFVVQGTLAQLDNFVKQVKAEGARVTHGLPPFDTNTGGDKADGASRPGLTAEPKPGDARRPVLKEEEKARGTQRPVGKADSGGKK